MFFDLEIMFIALCGKPSVGKSTFFKAATLADVEIANYPFTTIKSNEGVAYVKVDCVDTFFKTQCNPRNGYCIAHKRFIPIKLMDVPGLVEGSYKGMGMGNEFLSDISGADAIIHVIDASGGTNEKGDVIEEGSYDPENDVKFLENELDMWYVGIMKRGWDKFARSLHQEKENIIKTIAKRLSGLKVTETYVADTIKQLNLVDKIPDSWSEEEIFNFAKILRVKTKPMIIVANKCDREIARKNVKRLQETFKDKIIIPCSGDAEIALREANKSGLIKYIPGENTFEIYEGKLNEKQKAALQFIQKNVLDIFGSTGVQEALNRIIFELLHYTHLYPGGMNNLKDKDGRTLPDCFLMRNGSTALDFAFRIHTDIGNKFVKAMDVKRRVPVGKEHVLKDGDVIEIMTAK